MKNYKETRKEQILNAAERVFAKKGYQDATISDVAREANASDATIYKYFSSKEDLLFSIPAKVTEKVTEDMEFHLNHVRGAANKIRSIIYHYLWFYKNHPDYSSVALLILKRNRKFLETEAYQKVREGSRVVVRTVKEGVALGEFNPYTNPYLVRSMILGTIEHIVIRWLLHGSPKDLLQFVDPLTDMVIEGIKKGRDSRRWNLRIALEPEGSPPSNGSISKRRAKNKPVEQSRNRSPR